MPDDNATWDVPLPDVCQPYRQPCNKVQSMSEEEQQCYIFRLLSAYSELLRYVPPGHASEEQAMTADDLSMVAGVSVVRRWRIQTDPELEDFVSRCARLIDGAAE